VECRKLGNFAETPKPAYLYNMYPTFVKPLLFLLPPELAHKTAVALLKCVLKLPFAKSLFKRQFGYGHPALERTVMGLRFKNPVGLAAGFDKDGESYAAMQQLGFGFVEVGTATPLPQSGNPKPRLFRLPKDRALINRMGFNNAGVEKLAAKLRKNRPDGLIIGGNIGKNKVTKNEDSIKDYETAFRALFPYVDYFTINVSSPNTPDLRALQDKAPLKELLSRLSDINATFGRPKPILLKIAPDLDFQQIDDVIEVILETKIEGIICTNTTIDRSNLSTDADSIGAGGLSGQPLAARATEVIRYVRQKAGMSVTIIGVGGILSPDDAIEKIRAGADLLQIYTGLIYQGPGLVRDINKKIIQELYC
jgi:dihydroorotate dehydrogenase